MRRFIANTSLAVVFAALSAVGIVQVSGIAFAQAPEKGKASAARQAPRAATPAPRAAARAPAQRPATLQRSRPQRPAVAQRRSQPRAAEHIRTPNRAVVQSNTRAHIQRQAQERPRQLKKQQALPSQLSLTPKQAIHQNIDALRGQQRAQPVSRVQVTDEQRRNIHRSVFKDHRKQTISRSRLGVALAIGSRIPRRHRLYRFTPALLALAPLYAAYSYLVVDDTICIVDPDSYAIVDVIPASIEQAGATPLSSQGALALSGEQMQCVYASVPKDQAQTDLRIRLALGAEIPRSVRLFSFPDGALACAPELANYSYIVVEGDVVIVNPVDYAIVQIISA
jgi:hypothetical protein